LNFFFGFGRTLGLFIGLVGFFGIGLGEDFGLIGNGTGLGLLFFFLGCF
jgi:hypothetical protein